MTHQNLDISQPGESKIKPRASVAPEKKDRIENTQPKSAVEPATPRTPSEPDMPNKLYEEQLPPENDLA